MSDRVTQSLVRVVGSNDVADWRDLARDALARDLSPERIVWIDPADPQPMLSGPSETPLSWADLEPAVDTPVLPSSPPPRVLVPPKFLDLARLALAHRDPRKWDALYRILWRLARGERSLLNDAADADVHEASALAKAVKRDAHKMKAFVRFRRVVEPASDGTTREHYIAFHRPDHPILPLVAPFFARRFGIMHWTILTPFGSAAWNGSSLTYGPPTPSRERITDDGLEQLWRTYYASIFNPARANPRAMTREMPVRYWGTLPEAQIIDELLKSAPARVGTMLVANASADDASAFIPQSRPLSLPQLREAGNGCRGCPLWERATRAVFGEGAENASIMLVGEQPGDQEDLQGRPFVGPAGQLLDEALVAAGLDRATLYVTNAVKHFKWVPEPRGKRRLHANPSALEARACRAWLDHEIALVKPRVIVPLGATAGRSLLGASFRVGTMRGRVLADTPLAPALVVATIHPSAILRMPDEATKSREFAALVRDLILARDTSRPKRDA